VIGLLTAEELPSTAIELSIVQGLSGVVLHGNAPVNPFSKLSKISLVACLASIALKTTGGIVYDVVGEYVGYSVIGEADG
jgi:hypothetical protein